MNRRLKRISIRLAIGIGVPLAVLVGIAIVSNQGNTTTPPSSGSTSYPSATLGNTPAVATSAPTAQPSTSSVVSQEEQLCGGPPQAGIDGASASCKIILTNSDGSTDSFIILFDARATSFQILAGMMPGPLNTTSRGHKLTAGRRLSRLLQPRQIVYLRRGHISQ
jgi:hypothetical protein